MGLPDFTQRSLIQGLKADNTPQGVLLDEEGRIVALIYGASTTIPIEGSVDATPTNTTRQIEGYDGANYIPIAVDGAGRLIMVPYGVTQVSGTVDANPTNTTREIQGTDGTTLRTLAVDSEGRLVALVHGKHDTSIEPVSLDDAGRMEAVIVEASDPTGTYPAIGLGEVANRLGSGMQWDPRGRILWYWDFEHGLPMKPQIVATGSGAYHIVGGYQAQGGYCLKGITGSASTDKIYLQNYAIPKVGGRFGLEIAFSLTSSALNVIILLRGRIGGYFFEAGIRVRPGNSRIDYYTSSAAWATFKSGVTVNTDGLAYDKVKFVFDATSGKYERIIFDDKEWVATTYNGNWFASSGASYLLTWVEFDNTTTGSKTFYLDNIITTHMEPPNP